MAENRGTTGQLLQARIKFSRVERPFYFSIAITYLSYNQCSLYADSTLQVQSDLTTVDSQIEEKRRAG